MKFFKLKKKLIKKFKKMSKTPERDGLLDHSKKSNWFNYSSNKYKVNFYSMPGHLTMRIQMVPIPALRSPRLQKEINKFMIISSVQISSVAQS